MHVRAQRNISGRTEVSMDSIAHGQPEPKKNKTKKKKGGMTTEVTTGDCLLCGVVHVGPLPLETKPQWPIIVLWKPRRLKCDKKKTQLFAIIRGRKLQYIFFVFLSSA